MKTLGVVYTFSRGTWIKHSTNDLVERLASALQPKGIAVAKIGLLDSRVEIRANKLVVRDAKTKRRYSYLDGIYIANWRKAPEVALALAKYMTLHKKGVLNNEILHFPAMTKLGEMVHMSNQGIPLPDSFFVREKYLQTMVNKQKLPAGFAFPLIVKSTGGSMGADNWLVHTFQELANVVSKPHNFMLVVQQYIPNDFDYRVLVFGGKVRAVIKRSRLDTTTHLNNTSQGGQGDIVPLEEFPSELADIALQAAAATYRSDLAGVDIIVDTVTHKPYVLEVNKSPQIETGSNIDTKTRIFTDYAQECLHA